MVFGRSLVGGKDEKKSMGVEQEQKIIQLSGWLMVKGC